MRYLALLTFITSVVAFQRFFPTTHKLSYTTTRSSFPTSILLANKLDGVEIEGDLSPLSNNVLVQVRQAESKIGSIFIPDSSKERPTEGHIVAVGPGKIHPETGAKLDMSVNVGDHVLYTKYDGIELSYNDEPHRVIQDEDVLLKYSGDSLSLTNVECVKDYVLVRVPPLEEKTASGLFLGKQNKKVETGLVEKVGPGRQAANGEYMDLQVKPSDGVRFREYAANPVKIEGVDFVVVRATDILAKW